MIDMLLIGGGFFVSVLSFFVGLISFFTVRSIMVKYFSVITAMAGFKGFFYDLYFSGLIVHVPYIQHLYGWHILGSYMTLPLATIALLSIVYPDYRPKGIKLFLYFLPVLIRFITLIPFLSLAPELKYEELVKGMPYRHPDDITETGNYPLFIYLACAYMGICLYVYHHKINWHTVFDDLKKKQMPRNILFYLYLITWMQVFFIWFYERSLNAGFFKVFLVSSLIMQFNIVLYNIILALYPSLLHLGILHTNDQFTLKKYLKSRLRGVDLFALEKNLSALIENDKIYQIENLKLEALAEKLRVTPYQLSEYFNTVLGENFTNYINRHRINHAKELITSRDTNLLNIALDSGFNSYSAFYTIFRNVTGYSPRNFQRNFPNNDLGNLSEAESD